MIKQEIHLENVFSRNLKCFKHRPLNIWEFIEVSIRLHSKKTCIIDDILEEKLSRKDALKIYGKKII